MELAVSTRPSATCDDTRCAHADGSCAHAPGHFAHLLPKPKSQGSPSASSPASSPTAQQVAVCVSPTGVHPAAWARAACPHRDGTDDLLGAFACATAAIARLNHWPRTRAHPCDSSCPFLVHGDYYICLWNGNYHQCTAETCDRLEDHDDARVCPLSCISYPLEFRATYEMGERSSEQRRNTYVGTAKKPRRKRGGCDGLSVTPAAAAAVPPTTPTASRRVEAALDAMCEVEKADTLRVVRMLLPQLSAVRQGELSDEVLVAYQRIKQTSAFRNSNGLYTLAVHATVALLSMAQSGSIHGGRVFLRAHDDVRQTLPHLDACATIIVKLDAKFRSNFKHYTKAMYAYAHEWCTRF